jgi:hypothetical protein
MNQMTIHVQSADTILNARRKNRMKHGKRPTLNQKKLIEAARLNPDNWLIVKNLPDQLHIVHRDTGNERVIEVA